MDWSPQQRDFLKEAATGTSSIILTAVAGAGKTSTVLGAVPMMRGQCAILAFNVKIANEIKAKLKDRDIDFKKAEAGTCHSFGFRAYRKMFPDVKVDEHKVGNLVIEMTIDGKIAPDMGPYTSVICKIVSLAKQRAIGIESSIDDASLFQDIVDHFDLFETEAQIKNANSIVAAAQKVLDASYRTTNIVDFDDMIVMPVYHRVRFWTYENIFIDEAQDTNPARRALVKAMLRRGGRVIAVGDPCQPLGTQISVPVNNNRWKRNAPATVSIEDIQVGSKVVSYEPSDCTFVSNGRVVNGVTRKPYQGELVKVTDETGRVTRYTPHHRCYATAEPLRHKFIVYLMRKGSQFRVGKTRFSYGPGNGTGLVTRANQEGADGVWILAVCDTSDEAFFKEQAISGRFGIPQLMFSSKKLSGPAQKYLPEAWDFIGENTSKADICLASYGLDIRYPLFDLVHEDRLAKGSKSYASLKRPLPIRAVNLIKGMKMIPYFGDVHAKKSEWTSISVKHEFYDGDVVSLDVSGSKLYVADGLVTRNCQAIYAFTGADSEALDLIEKEFKAKRMPLTVTYRCPKKVVEFARQWVDHITAHESAPEGSVTSESFETFMLRPDLNADSVVLCRNTKPLVKAAFALIRKKIPCRIEGREIGDGLKKLAERWSTITTINALENKLHEYREREVAKFLLQKKAAKVQEIEDKVETLNVIMDQCREEGKAHVRDVIAHISTIFADNVTGMLTLSTIHKSKGREWKRVFWLDRDGTCPSPYAKQAWERKAENCLCYVAATRSMDQLIELSPPPTAIKKPKPANEDTPTKQRRKADTPVAA